MQLRWRLSLWYGTLCALALAVVAFAGYGASVREQYLTLDRVLVVSARLVETGLQAYGRSYALRTDTLGPARTGIVVVLRRYSSTGMLIARSPSDPGLPSTEPKAPLRSPAPPAYQGRLPFVFTGGPVPTQPGTAFGTLTVSGQRWRRYVVTVDNGARTLGYVEALTPLGQQDENAARLARILLNLTLASLVAVLTVGWWVAGSALRPIDRITRTARAITQSRDLSQRVHAPDRADEVGRLAATFNEMLHSLDTAWQSQQRFVGDASHELRAPLTVMRGNLELLRRYPHLGAAEREDMLGDIERDAARLTRLVEDLLLLARSDAGVTLTRRPVDLRAVSSEALRDARLLAYGHQLSLQAPAGSFTVQGDADRLKQLLLILLDNAMKYSVPGSPVQVSLSEEPGARVLRVTDAGPGIADDALPQIYERFFRADPARTRDQVGSGLGLAIGRWISEQHEARLFVEHTGPTGTTFTVHFPLAAGGQPGNVQQGWPKATALADSRGTSSTHT